MEVRNTGFPVSKAYIIQAITPLLYNTNLLHDDEVVFDIEIKNQNTDTPMVWVKYKKEVSAEIAEEEA